MINFFTQFGGTPTQDLKKEYAQSDRWIKGKFRNLERTELSMDMLKLPSIIYKQFVTKGKRTPKGPLPILPFDKDRFFAKSEQAKMIWYGHSAIVMRVANKTILIDPMLGPNTTPIAPVANRRFSKDTLSLIDSFADIDVVSHSCGTVQITFTPTRHFSGRGLRDRMMTLWGGWLIQSPQEKIWFSGDGGYGKHFKEIGEKLGPFDLAFMECGQYNDDWRPVHLFPDESVQAAIDAQVRKAMPVHWGGFDLSYQHTWHQPPEEFVMHARSLGMNFSLPRIGEIFMVDSVLEEIWWEEFV